MTLWRGAPLSKSRVRSSIQSRARCVLSFHVFHCKLLPSAADGFLEILVDVPSPRAIHMRTDNLELSRCLQPF